MSDERMRRTEREARQGSVDAELALHAQRRRTSVGVGGWPAAQEFYQAVHEASRLVEKAAVALRAQQSLGVERGANTTWSDVDEALRVLDLARALTSGLQGAGTVG